MHAFGMRRLLYLRYILLFGDRLVVNLANGKYEDILDSLSRRSSGQLFPAMS